MNDSTLIVLKARRNTRYTTICLDAVEDKRLSWKAKGLHLYLLSRPDGWKIRITDLLRRSSGGRSQILSAVAELRTFGYLVVEGARDDRGRYVGSVWTVYDVPIQAFSPESGFPTAEKPVPENLPINSTDNNTSIQPPQRRKDVVVWQQVIKTLERLRSVVDVSALAVADTTAKHGVHAASRAADVLLHLVDRGRAVARPAALFAKLAAAAANNKLERPSGLVFTDERAEEQKREAAARAERAEPPAERLAPDEIHALIKAAGL